MSKIFSGRYFARHECNLRDTSESNNEMGIDDEDLLVNDPFDSEGRIVSDLSNDGTYEKNDDGSDNEVRRDLFVELLQETYLIDDDNDYEIFSNKSEYGVLLRWICLSLAHWQRPFNMTDNALYFFVEMFFCFLQSFIQNC